MQLESIIPAHRALASGSIAFEDLVLVNALVVANGYTGAVDETNACTFSEAEQFKEHGHLYCYTRFQLNEAIVGHSLGEITLQITFHITQIVVLEVACNNETLMTFANAIARNIFVFWISMGNDFYTSDFPIVVSPHVENVRPMYMGLAQYGGELTMPLSPGLALSVYDRSYFKDKEDIDGAFVNADDKEVRRQNYLRYMYATQHVFSYKNDFSLIDFVYQLEGKHPFWKPRYKSEIVSGLGRY